MDNICRRHASGQVLVRKNGGWTTICPWCEMEGRYREMFGDDGHSLAPMYPRGAQYAQPEVPALFSEERSAK